MYIYVYMYIYIYYIWFWPTLSMCVRKPNPDACAPEPVHMRLLGDPLNCAAVVLTPNLRNYNTAHMHIHHMQMRTHAHLSQ